MKDCYTFYTIGHATRQMEEFISLLKRQNITLLVDVRSVPRSLKNPQFNESILPQALGEVDINYIRIPDLGGFRAKSKTIPLQVNGFWQQNSFHSYADYAMSDTFGKALNQLIELGKIQTPAIMCAEMLWWRCHRRIITDYLLACGQKVYHIIGANKTEPAKLCSNAMIMPNGNLTYP